MTKLVKYFILLKLCVLHNVYQTLSHSMQTHEKPANMTSDSENVTVVRFDSGPPISKKTIGAPISLLIHHMKKRAIGATQGSSWLKFVWRERQYKIPQMFLANIRNMWAVDPAGGRHLFDSGVPFGSVYLIKTLLLDIIFPRIGRNQ